MWQFVATTYKSRIIQRSINTSNFNQNFSSIYQTYTVRIKKQKNSLQTPNHSTENNQTDNAQPWRRQPSSFSALSELSQKQAKSRWLVNKSQLETDYIKAKFESGKSGYRTVPQLARARLRIRSCTHRPNWIEFVCFLYMPRKSRERAPTHTHTHYSVAFSASFCMTVCCMLFYTTPPPWKLAVYTRPYFDFHKCARSFTRGNFRGQLLLPFGFIAGRLCVYTLLSWIWFEMVFSLISQVFAVVVIVWFGCSGDCGCLFIRDIGT